MERNKGRLRAGALAAPAGGLAGSALLAAGQGVRPLVSGWIAAEIERRRLFLWLPVFFGGGVLLYFAVDREPSLWAPVLGAALFAAGALRARQNARPLAFAVCIALAFLFAGFAAACLRTIHVAAPVLQRITTVRVTGYVETLDARGAGARALIRVTAMAGVEPAAMPQRIRVTARSRAGLEPGATIAATMRLLPPARASEPGGYDFAREAFFAGIGAVGSIPGAVERLLDDTGIGWTSRLRAFVDSGRNALTDRIIAVAGGGKATGDAAVAAALVTGKRGLIPEEANEDLRAAGIYHVVSISGLHMVLAAGLFFWSFRAVLALFPAVALTRPVKQWAALFAMAGAIAYNIFSGSEVATVRSLIMTLVMLGAILAGRRALALRNLAIAALIVLALQPETLLGASFQMSFAAVAVMIAAFEPGLARREKNGAPESLFGRARFWFTAAILSTLVASLATDPFALFHFHRITPYGLIGNTLALPLVEFIVMPFGLLGVVALPFGLDAFCWHVMGFGVSAMMGVARWVAGLPGAATFLPGFGGGALLVMALGILWWAIWLSPLRWAGAPIFLAGMVLAAATPQPAVKVDAQARAMAVRGADGRLQVANAQASLFGVSQWLSADADGRSPRAPDIAGKARCDRLGCTAPLADGRMVALVRDRQALAEDCARAAIVITPLWTRGLCAGPDLVLDGAHFANRGASALHIEADGRWRLEADRREGFDRPWSPAARTRIRPATIPASAPAGSAAEQAADEDPRPFAPD